MSSVLLSALVIASLMLPAAKSNQLALSVVTVRIILPTMGERAPSLRIASLDSGHLVHNTRMTVSGRLATASFYVPPGYYQIQARLPGVVGTARVAVLQSMDRDITLSLMPSRAAPIAKVSGGTEVTGAIAARAPATNVTIYAKPSDLASVAGTWITRDGDGFYGDDLSPGTYHLFIHFDNCCGFTQDVTINAGRVRQFTFDVSRYYAQTFSSLTKSPELFGVAVAQDGTPWFVEYLGTQNRIGHRLSDGRLVEWTPQIPPSAIWRLTPRPDGSLWFLETQSGVLGEIDSRGVLHEYKDTMQPSLDQFAFGPDGSIWLLTGSGLAVEHMERPGDVHVFRLTTVIPDEEVRGMLVTADNVLWFTDYDGNRVMRIDAAGDVEQFKVPWTCGPISIVEWADRYALECDSGPASIVGLDQAGRFSVIASSAHRTRELIVDNSGNLFSVNSNGTSVDRFNPNGSTTKIAVAQTAQNSARLFATSHHLWYFDTDKGTAVDLESPTLGVITFAGSMKYTDFSVSPDDAVWFSMPYVMQLVRLGDDRSVSIYPIAPVPPRMP
jgi:streptogramin lyase